MEGTVADAARLNKEFKYTELVGHWVLVALTLLCSDLVGADGGS